MKKYFCVSIMMGLLSWGSAFADTPMSRQPIEHFSTALGGKFPRVPLIEMGSADVSTQPLDPRVAVVVAEINEAAFGAPLFELLTCKACDAVSNMGKFQVFVGDKFVHQLDTWAPDAETAMKYLRFTIAHEISHYLYELSISNREKEEGIHRSPNGNKSYLELMKTSTPCSDETQRAHAEVDLIAIRLLERQGDRDIRPAAIELLKKFKFCDSKFRIENLQSAQ